MSSWVEPKQKFGNARIEHNIYSLLELIVDLFDIVRKFKDIEGEKLVSEYEGFLDFLDDNFFNKEFADIAARMGACILPPSISVRGESEVYDLRRVESDLLCRNLSTKLLRYIANG